MKNRRKQNDEAENSRDPHNPYSVLRVEQPVTTADAIFQLLPMSHPLH